MKILKTAIPALLLTFGAMSCANNQTTPEEPKVKEPVSLLPTHTLTTEHSQSAGTNGERIEYLVEEAHVFQYYNLDSTQICHVTLTKGQRHSDSATPTMCYDVVKNDAGQITLKLEQ